MIDFFSKLYETYQSKRQKRAGNPERWSRIDRSELSQSRDRVYQIMDNGYCPFMVKIRRDSVRIFTWDKDDSDHGYHPKLILTIPDFMGFWSGYDSERTRKPIHGNSILVQVDLHRYVYVGANVYSFITTDQILDYVSPVGNNFVPYPVAFGSKYVYWMEERNKTDRSKVPYQPETGSMKLVRLDDVPSGLLKFSKIKQIQMIHGRYYEKSRTKCLTLKRRLRWNLITPI